MTDVLFVTGAAPAGSQYSNYSYPWHRLADDLVKMGVDVRVLAPVNIVSRRTLLRGLTGIAAEDYDYRGSPSFRGLMPRWQKVGLVQTMFAARRLYPGRIAELCKSAGILHFPRVQDFIIAQKLIGDDLFAMTYVVTPRSSCLKMRGPMENLWDQMYRHAYRIVYPSESVRRNAVAISSEYDAGVITHGIESIWYDTSRGPLHLAGREMVRLVTTCGLVQWKGTDHLITAVAQAPGLDLTVIGDGPHRKQLENLVKDAGVSDRVRFTGWLKPAEIIDIYDRSDVFVMPSRGETLGLVFLEALARRMPIIGMVNSGAYGMFPGCRNASFLREEYGPDDLRSLAMQSVDHEFGQCRCGKCVARYERAGTAQAFARVYSEALPGKGSGL